MVSKGDFKNAKCCGKIGPACDYWCSFLQSAGRRRSGDFHTALWYAHNLFTLLVRKTCCVSFVGRVTYCTVVARTHLHTHILFIQQPCVTIKQRVCQSSFLGQHLHVEKAFVFPGERPSNASKSTELELEVVIDGLQGQPCKTLFLIWAFAWRSSHLEWQQFCVANACTC